MKKREREADNEESHHYPASTIPGEVNLFAVRLFEVMEKKGMKRSEFLLNMQEAGYNMSYKTFGRHIQGYKMHGSILNVDKETGAIPSLSFLEKDIAAGFVFMKNTKNEIVNVKHYKHFVLQDLKIDISLSTARNYLHEAGFSSRAVSKKSRGFTFDGEKMRDVYWQFINQCRIDGVFLTRASRLCSLDFVFTSHRSDRFTTFIQKNGPQPKAAIPLSKYTNCIITMVWCDGVNRTPSCVFSYNPDFNINDDSSTEKTRKSKLLKEYLDHYEISEDRVIYMPQEKGERKTFVRESSFLIYKFFEIYKIEKHCVIFTDASNAFFNKKVDVLLEIGFHSHHTYPPEVHHLLSPNDNNLHSTSKKSWMHTVNDHFNDTNSTFFLMSCLDQDTTSHSKRWFEENLIKPSDEQIKQSIGIGNIENSRYRRKCMDAYELFINNNHLNN